MISPIHEIVIQEWMPESYTIRIDGRPSVPATNSEELVYLLGLQLPCIHNLLTTIQELEGEVAKYEDALGNTTPTQSS